MRAYAYGRTTSRKELRRQVKEARLEVVEDLEPLEQRPQRRGDCENGPRPCPFVSCKWNLYLDVNSHGGIKFNFPGVELEDLPQTCALDVADRGGETLEEVGRTFGVTRERIRQIENNTLKSLEHLPGAQALRDAVS